MSHPFFDVVDRPIAYQRPFVRLGAGVTGAVLLSQLVYWQKRMNGKWFYKTQAELEEETGLSRYEQEGARKKLVATGVLKEMKKGIPAKLYFLIDADRLQELLLPTVTVGNSRTQGCGKTPSCNVENQQAGPGDFPGQSCGNPASIPTEDYTENTSEITTENKSLGTSAKAAEPTRSGKHEYSPEFETAWQTYPKRAGGNPKATAWKNWSARIREGVTTETLLAGVQRYAAYIQATGKAGSEYVKQTCTFFGPDRHFDEAWQAPATPQRQTASQQKHSNFDSRDYGQTQTPAWGRGNQ